MFTLRPTKTLARQLGIVLPTSPPPVPSRIADWCAHSFQVGRHSWLIFCNTASLYPVIAGGTRVHDGGSLIRRAGGMILQVLDTNQLVHQSRVFAAELRAVQWAPIPDRSVLGSINEMIRLADEQFTEPNAMPGDLSRRLARAPMSALGMNSPADAFASLRS